MPPEFTACIKNGGRVRTKNTKDGFIHICFPKGGGPGIAGEPHKKEDCDLQHTENMKNTVKWVETFHVDEAAKSDKGVKIRGTAVTATTSRNGVTYELNELSKSVNSLIGKTIGLDHNEKITDTVAVIDNASVNGDKIEYEATVFDTPYHPKITEFIRSGLVKNVSLEAFIPQFRVENNKKIASGIEFTGLSFIRTPGVPDASVTIAESLENLHFSGEEEGDEDLGDFDDEEIDEESMGFLESLAEKGIKFHTEKPFVKAPAGSGARFAACVHRMSGKVDDPHAVCAAIGRKKFGKKKFQKLAAKGKGSEMGESHMENTQPTNATQVVPTIEVKLPDEILSIPKQVESLQKELAEVKAKLAEKPQGIVTEPNKPLHREGADFTVLNERGRRVAFYKRPSYVDGVIGD